MDPITHAVVGLSIAVLGGEPMTLSNPALIGCIAGAVIPDGDIIMQIKGDYAYLKNHRGMSHSLPIMPIYALAITSVLWLLFGSIAFWKVLLFSIAGCLSHIALDIMNSYGAQVLWPFSPKRITLDLLLIYDPMIIILSLLTIIPKTRNLVPAAVVIAVFAFYLAARYMMKRMVKALIMEQYSGRKLTYLRVLPSMIGLIKWHFILADEHEKIIGEVNVFPRYFRVIKVLKTIDSQLRDMVTGTPVAEFFSEFTPIYHIACEQDAGHYVFRFIDLRYYIAKDFLHHATAVLNHDLEVVTSLFHPYHKGRNVEI